MKIIKVDKALVYSVGFDASLLILDTNFGRRIYLNEFQKIDLYGMEFIGGRK